jgi:hypothetical protein
MLTAADAFTTPLLLPSAMVKTVVDPKSWIDAAMSTGKEMPQVSHEKAK